MTSKEAIERIKDHMEAHHIGEYPHIKLKEALDMALSALHPVTREQVEKVWLGHWVTKNAATGDEEICKMNDSGHILSHDAICPYCGEWIVASDEYDVFANFCPSCGKAMSKKAVELVLKRLEALKDAE